MSEKTEAVGVGGRSKEGIFRELGHTSDAGRCEKCWREAATRYAMGQGPYESHVAAYFAVMAEAEDEVRCLAAAASPSPVAP